MSELLGHTLILFLLLYACLDIGYKLANYLLAKLSRAKGRRSYAIVFSDRNTNELEGIIRSMNRQHTDVCVVDVDTTEEGRKILAYLERELDYVHVISEQEFFDELPLQRAAPAEKLSAEPPSR